MFRLDDCLLENEQRLALSKCCLSLLLASLAMLQTRVCVRGEHLLAKVYLHSYIHVSVQGAWRLSPSHANEAMESRWVKTQTCILVPASFEIKFVQPLC